MTPPRRIRGVREMKNPFVTTKPVNRFGQKQFSGKPQADSRTRRTVTALWSGNREARGGAAIAVLVIGLSSACDVVDWQTDPVLAEGQLLKAADRNAVLDAASAVDILIWGERHGQ